MTSWVAIDRVVETTAASDAQYRKRVAGRPLRSHAKPLTDAELLTKLASFGIELDRTELEELCDNALSAEEIARPLIEQCDFGSKRDQLQGDWIWICITALWQRWFPDKPCFEALDDKMQAGYDAMTRGDATAACFVWLDAWADVLGILDKAGFQSVKDFDNHFRGTQFLFNWIQDLEDELWHAGLEDKQFIAARIAFCEEALKRFEATDDELMTSNRRRALAESYFELGEAAKTDALYSKWLRHDPQWGWGWIGWSDCYRFTRSELRDFNRAEQLLLQGLAVARVRDPEEISHRLADLYEDQTGANDADDFPRVAGLDSAAVTHTLEIWPDERLLRQKTTFTFGDEGLPLDEMPSLRTLPRTPPSQITASSRKVGRNEPCPCGSGRKFKKCCAGS